MKLTLILPHYQNYGMVREQERYWQSWPESLKAQTEIIVVDDCSPEGPPVMRDCGIRTRLYRIGEDVPWNWLEARNIGARHADGRWLLLTDMDHAVPAETVSGILYRIDAGLDGRKFYTLARRDAPDLAPYKHHPDSFLMRRKFFWKVGGYDEHYAGHYGTSGLWRRRCRARGEAAHLGGMYLIRYPREVVPDASTTVLARKEGRDPDAIRRVTEWKQAMGCTRPALFRQPYELVWECPQG